MLQSLVDGKESSQCIVIEDSTEISGRGLLKCFLNSLTARFDVVHVVLYEVSPSKFTKGLPPHVLSRLKIHDGVSDPLGWHNVTATSHDDTDTSHSVINLNTDLSQHLRRCSDVTNVAVVIDTLDQLLLHRTAAYTCQTLHRLRQGLGHGQDADTIQLVTLVHRDLHDDVTLGLLRHSATSCVKVEPPKDAVNYQFGSRVLHKRASGKILQGHEQFTLTNHFTISDISDVLHIMSKQSDAPTMDPTSGITFNLSLSDAEKDARSRLVLPYTRPPTRHSDPVSGGAAKIFYQPDDADDFDEEDPDDDLDV